MVRAARLKLGLTEDRVSRPNLAANLCEGVSVTCGTAERQHFGPVTVRARLTGSAEHVWAAGAVCKAPRLEQRTGALLTR